MRISQIAEIQSGHQFRGKVETDPSGTVGVIQIKDIVDRRWLTPETIDRIAFEKSYARYLVCPGDVLFLSRGHRPFAVAIERDLGPVIASGYFYIVRLQDERVRPDFLAWYLNQPPMQEQFKQLAKGTHMPFVSMADFCELDIPTPPLATQQRIVALAALAEEEQTILTQIASKRANLIQTTCLTAAGMSLPAAT